MCMLESSLNANLAKAVATLGHVSYVDEIETDRANY